MQFQELTDKQWDIIKPHIPKPATTGRPRSNDRMILNGIIYVLISGLGGVRCQKYTVMIQLPI